MLHYGNKNVKKRRVVGDDDSGFREVHMLFSLMCLAHVHHHVGKHLKRIANQVMEKQFAFLNGRIRNKIKQDIAHHGRQKRNRNVITECYPEENQGSQGPWRQTSFFSALNEEVVKKRLHGLPNEYDAEDSYN